MKKVLREFLRLESASGIILLAATLLAMVWANSPFSYLHKEFVNVSLFAINEGLMAVFFLMVGLELKRGFIFGSLSQPSHVLLPAIAALGGMAAPALIYCRVNLHDPVAIHGWAIPVATDIAFALGVLALFGRRVPTPLKLFLLALAIFDDIGAILIIAFFYSQGISYLFLLLAAALVALLYLINRYNVRSLIPYLLIGILLWICLLYTGIHPTIAGVVLALAIPGVKSGISSPMQRLEHRLHPYVAYGIMPLFALANAGIDVAGLSYEMLFSTVVIGIVLGLFIGKQIGVFGLSWLLVRYKLVKLPESTSWQALYGVALLCGIGFTMSLFLGTLSFQNAAPAYLLEVKVGVILGSMLSGLVGGLVLLVGLPKKIDRR